MSRRQRLFFLLAVIGLAACVPAVPPTPVPPTFTPGPPTTEIPTSIQTTETPTLISLIDTPTAETPVPVNGPCPIVVRTPPPSAPTASLNGTPQPERRIDPHVEICASTPTLKVNESVTIVGQAVDIGLPYFQIRLKDSGAAEFAQLVEVTYDNQIRNSADVSQVLELVSAQADLNRVTVVVRARTVGETEVAIGATGEIHFGYPGPAMWSGGGSDSISITVTE